VIDTLALSSLGTLHFHVAIFQKVFPALVNQRSGGGHRKKNLLASTSSMWSPCTRTLARVVLSLAPARRAALEHKKIKKHSPFCFSSPLPSPDRHRSTWG
jgi:hypothetical protein